MFRIMGAFSVDKKNQTRSMAMRLGCHQKRKQGICCRQAFLVAETQPLVQGYEQTCLLIVVVGSFPKPTFARQSMRPRVGTEGSAGVQGEPGSCERAPLGPADA